MVTLRHLMLRLHIPDTTQGTINYHKVFSLLIVNYLKTSSPFIINYPKASFYHLLLIISKFLHHLLLIISKLLHPSIKFQKQSLFVIPSAWSLQQSQLSYSHCQSVSNKFLINLLKF